MRSELPQVEAWTPENTTLAKAARVIGRQARQGKDFALFSVDNVGVTKVEKAEIVTFAGAGAHTDPTFTRYFVLLVAHAPRSRPTFLHTAPGRERRNAPAHEPAPSLTPQASAELIPGQIVILDAHQWHWVPTPPAAARHGKKWETLSFEDRERRMLPHLTFCVTTESRRRPTRAQAEAKMSQYLQERAPLSWAEAVAATPAPSRRPARP